MGVWCVVSVWFRPLASPNDRIAAITDMLQPLFASPIAQKSSFVMSVMDCFGDLRDLLDPANDLSRTTHAGWRPQRLTARPLPASEAMASSTESPPVWCLTSKLDPTTRLAAHVTPVASLADAVACLQLGLGRVPGGLLNLDEWNALACLCVTVHVHSATHGHHRLVYVTLPHQLTASAVSAVGSEAAAARHLFTSFSTTPPPPPPHTHTPLPRFLLFLALVLHLACFASALTTHGISFLLCVGVVPVCFWSGQCHA